MKDNDDLKFWLGVAAIALLVIVAIRYPAAISVLIAFAGVRATAQCRDDTFSFSRERCGTCSHHGGVEAWYRPLQT